MKKLQKSGALFVNIIIFDQNNHRDVLILICDFNNKICMHKKI